MGTIETASGPGTTVEVSGNSPGLDGTSASTSVKPGLLVAPSTGTYGNGYEVASAAYGDANASEGTIRQVEILATHPQNKTSIYDKTTAFAAGDHIVVKEHIIGKTYWLKGSSLTVALDGKIITAANGLVAAQTAHTATPLTHHTWVCVKAVSSATWVQGRYIGITTMFTAS